jgi:hypothetical protein
MDPAARPTAHSRDVAHRLLRRVTLWVTGAAAVAFVAFTAIAAATIPGIPDAATASAPTSPTTTSDASSAIDSSPFQQPPSLPQATRSGGAHAVSGGS